MDHKRSLVATKDTTLLYLYLFPTSSLSSLFQICTERVFPSGGYWATIRVNTWSTLMIFTTLIACMRYDHVDDMSLHTPHIHKKNGAGGIQTSELSLGKLKQCVMQQCIYVTTHAIITLIPYPMQRHIPYLSS